MFNIKSFIFLSFILLSLHAQDLPNKDEVLCAAAIFPEVCPAVYEPVCVASPKQCFTTPCYQTDTISNGCEACKTEGVQSYTPGRCQYTCEAGNLPPGTLEPVGNPVCGSYVEDCQDASCRATFSSSTVACQDPDVVSFSLGECDDEGDGEWNEECTLEEEEWNEEECSLEEEDWNDDIEYCTGERPEICTMIYDPVCVVECVSGECRRTAGNACTACGDADVLGYIPGECEPEKIRCPVLDLSATDIACTEEYNPVCGYTDDCNDQSCGVTADNPCYACVFGGKDYYTQGACESNGAYPSDEEAEAN